ncbi:MAG TPA: hypothetical protein VGE38_11055 [Nocardioides sp.]
MTTTPIAPQAPRRVRHQAREAAVVMVFSAGTSLGIALVLLVLASLTQQG